MLTSLLLAWGAVALGREQPPAVSWRPLDEVLRSTLRAEALQGSVYSIMLVDLESGQEIFSHQPQLILNPASVTKIFTTAAALCLLHPEYRFKTELYISKKPAGGVISGPIYLKGYGDPLLVDERMALLAAQIRARGIKRIDGPLFIDESFFDGERDGPGWEQENGSDAYLAPSGALNANFNTLQLFIMPGEREGLPAQVDLLPPSLAVKLENRILTHHRSTLVRTELRTEGDRIRLTLRGVISRTHPGLESRVRVDRPGEYTAAALLAWLRQQGIAAPERIRRGTVSPDAELYLTSYSPPVSDLVRVVNKISQNFVAEQLFKTLGAEFLGPPASWRKGQLVMEKFLEEEAGIAPGTYVLHNGSGLNDVNRVSAAQVVKLLRAIWRRFDVQADFAASLALAGADGTMTGRLTHPALIRRLRVKTGGLHNSRSLAGYLENSAGRRFAFAIIVNDYRTDGVEVTRVIDDFISAVVFSDAQLSVPREIDSLPMELLFSGEQSVQ